MTFMKYVLLPALVLSSTQLFSSEINLDSTTKFTRVKEIVDTENQDPQSNCLKTFALKLDGLKNDTHLRIHFLPKEDESLTFKVLDTQTKQPLNFSNKGYNQQLQEIFFDGDKKNYDLIVQVNNRPVTLILESYTTPQLTEFYVNSYCENKLALPVFKNTMTPPQSPVKQGWFSWAFGRGNKGKKLNFDTPAASQSAVVKYPIAERSAPALKPVYISESPEILGFSREKWKATGFTTSQFIDISPTHIQLNFSDNIDTQMLSLSLPKYVKPHDITIIYKAKSSQTNCFVELVQITKEEDHAVSLDDTNSKVLMISPNADEPENAELYAITARIEPKKHYELRFFKDESAVPTQCDISDLQITAAEVGIDDVD